MAQIMSTDAEKSFHKIQHSFMIKAVGIEGTYLNSCQHIYDKLLPNTILNGNAEAISSKVRNETRVSIIPILIQYTSRIPSQSSKTRERN
jgi:hypothetical protein